MSSTTTTDDINKPTKTTIPIINIESWINPSNFSNIERQKVVDEINQACCNVGFFGIIGHGCCTNVIQEAWDASRDFFDMPLEYKLKFKSKNDQEYPYGYENQEVLSIGKQQDQQKQQEQHEQEQQNTNNNNDNKGSSSTTTTSSSSLQTIPPPPDLKETYAIGPNNPNSGMPPRQLIPDKPENFGQSLFLYYEAMEALALKILNIMAVALQLNNNNNDEENENENNDNNNNNNNFFETRMDHHFSALRILNYYPIKLSQILPGQLRASPHTDYGIITILKSGGPGLQVKKDDIDSNDCWVDVPYLPNAFIINLGDMMRQWTNDRWLSTLHRVIVTKEDAERRQSIAYFVNVNGDCIVDPRDLFTKNHNNQEQGEQQQPKYKPISAKQHLMKKHLASMGISIQEEEEEEKEEKLH